ncbi:SDR family oxidoreductase [Algihabitans albus]|uniref:SDR family oxidoreductase n=1 Tax=Algihabitans albus TaxID=2164067 RepID=UPI000E5C8D66|nr:SDR family oxidoreductase [Algihabitans albus]
MSDPFFLPDALPRTALVTGAGKRIGRAIALSLAQAGFSVAIHYKSSSAEAEAVAEEVRAAGGEATLLKADLARETDVAGLVARGVEALGPLGVLVNNASTFEMDRVDSVTRDSWDHHMEPNLRAPFVLIQDFAKHLPEQAEGAVINLLDQRVWNLTPYFVSYSVAKSGLWTLTRTLALALAPRIRVNAIGPGPTLPSTHQTDAQFERQWRAMPLQRGTTPEEIALAVRFLLAARAMTGQMLALDGGQHLGWSQPQAAPDHFA